MMTDEQARAAARTLDKLAFADMVHGLEALKYLPLRERVEKLTQTLVLARAEEGAQLAETTVRYAEYRRVSQVRARIEYKLLARARRDAIDEFARPRGWKYEGDLGVSELHTDSLAQTWCETCGGFCSSGSGPYYARPEHSAGQSTAFRARRGYRGRTEAVVLHTRRPLERCEAFAALFNLRVFKLDWSWFGLPIAALFVRAEDVRKFKL